MKLSIDEDADALHHILSSLPEIVILVDVDGIIRYINRVETGYLRDQVIGTSMLRVLTDDARGTAAAALSAVLSTGGTQEFEVETTSPDGSSVWYRARMEPHHKDGVLVGAVIVATNVTELKVSQNTIASLRRLLRICSWCERIHTPDNSWVTLEHYIATDQGTMLTHGMCPDCALRWPLP